MYKAELKISELNPKSIWISKVFGFRSKKSVILESFWISFQKLLTYLKFFYRIKIKEVGI